MRRVTPPARSDEVIEHVHHARVRPRPELFIPTCDRVIGPESWQHRRLWGVKVWTDSERVMGGGR